MSVLWILLVACWPHEAISRLPALTDHPIRANAEALLSGQQETGPTGQLPPALWRMNSDRRKWTNRQVKVPETKAATWILTAEGVPCSLPFWHEGQKYSGCHPEGWCCLDELCARTGACRDLAATKLPLQLPRDMPDSSCQLESIGGHFRWPQQEPGKSQDANLVFLILQKDQSLSDQEVGSLLNVSQEVHVEIVLMSYAARADVRQVMTKLQGQIQHLLANVSSKAATAIMQKLHLVTEPATTVAYHSCWLPSVIQAWSKDEEILNFWDEERELISTAAQGTRGGWATTLDAKFVNHELPLRWAGLLCGEEEPAGQIKWPTPSSELQGFVALVARGECSFYRKVSRAQALGATSVVIFSQDAMPISMGCAAPDPCDEVLKISAVMVGLEVGKKLLTALFPSNSSDFEDAEDAEEAEKVSARFGVRRQGPSMVGLLGQGGGLWYNTFPGFSRVSDEIRGMDFRRRLLRRTQELSEQADVLRISVFDKDRMPGSITKPWSQEQVALVRDGSYTELEIELRLDCDDHLDENCPPWDHELNLFVCTPGRSKHPTNCADSNDTIARWITAYGREGHWLTKAPGAIPLLAAQSTLRLATWQEYTVSLTFWFRRGSQYAPQARMPLWSGGMLDLAYNAGRPPIPFNVPTESTRVVLTTLITGHGWGVDEANCAEFCNHVHHFTVNGISSEQLVRENSVVSKNDGCQAQVLSGVVPNQFGTWPYGRAGWCPGKDVEWWEVDITPWIAEGENIISYRALFDGSEYDPVPSNNSQDLGFPAEIHLVSALMFYTDSSEIAATQAPAPGRSQPPRLLLP